MFASEVGFPMRVTIVTGYAEAILRREVDAKRSLAACDVTAGASITITKPTPNSSFLSNLTRLFRVPHDYPPP
jgi:hypothetical protein